jgi:hypothetical protein
MTRMLALVVVLPACTEEPRLYSTRAAEGEVIFSDDFEAGELGSHWQPTGEGASVVGGLLQVSGVKNHPLWLDLPLPDATRIEFDAWATTEEGDIKVELYGDGTTFATSMNYRASGYVVIFGGWNNTTNAIVRQDEHGRDRATSEEPKVEADRRYHFVITRTAGEILWEVDGKAVVTYEDQQPLHGPGHDRFAFSGWETTTQFDNLVIEAL